MYMLKGEGLKITRIATINIWLDMKQKKSVGVVGRIITKGKE